MTRLGPTRLKILCMVVDGVKLRFPPSLSELAVRGGVSKPCVHQHLEALKHAGLVDWEPSLARTLRPTCTMEAAEE